VRQIKETFKKRDARIGREMGEGGFIWLAAMIILMLISAYLIYQARQVPPTPPPHPTETVAE